MKLFWLFAAAYIIFSLLARQTRKRGQGGLPQPDYDPGGVKTGRGEGEYDDLPIQGPWSRRPNPEQVPAPDPAPVKADSENKIPVPVSEGTTPTGRDLPVEPADAAGREAAGDPGGTVEAPPEIHCPEQQDGRANLQSLFSPRGIYAGIVMAEVLGSRGGKSGFGRR